MDAICVGSDNVAASSRAAPGAYAIYIVDYAVAVVYCRRRAAVAGVLLLLLLVCCHRRTATAEDLTPPLVSPHPLPGIP